MKTPETTTKQSERAHRTAKNTIFDVYKYQGRGDWQVLKHTGTELLQTFSHIGHEFEVRLSKDKRTVYICLDGLIFERTNFVAEVIHSVKTRPDWYLQLNWTDAPEQISGEMAEKRMHLNTSQRVEHL